MAGAISEADIRKAMRMLGMPRAVVVRLAERLDQAGDDMATEKPRRLNGKSDHDARGRFAVGNPGGPGRPPAVTERSYLSVLAETVSLDRWRAICARQVEQAEAGDIRSVEWITRHLLGERPITLSELRMREMAGIDEGAELAALIELERDAGCAPVFRKHEYDTPLSLALDAAETATS